MPLRSLLEILLYELIDVSPHLLLAVVPFTNSFRFSRKKIAAALILFYVMMVFSRFVAMKSLTGANIMTLVWMVFYLTFYAMCMRTSLVKLFFVMLTILNYGSVVAILNHYIAFHWLESLKIRPLSFSASIVLICVYLVSFPVIYYLMVKKIKPLISSPGNNKYWDYLWLVPATFCLSYYYNLISNGGTPAFAAKFSNVLFAVFFNVGALFVSYLMMRLLEDSNSNLRLKSEIYQLNMQSLQYENLKNRIDDARRAKHDVRQNMAIIQSYVRDGDNNGLMNYINQYIGTLPYDSPILYSDNYALNALIVYYENIARASGIPFDAQIKCPKDIGIADADIVVLLGNLLENAIEACSRQSIGKPYIKLRIETIQESIVITLDNTYSGEIRQKENVFLSSKAERNGFGTVSIQKIVEKYKGFITFDFNDCIFHASAALYYRHHETEHMLTKETMKQEEENV